MKWMRGFLGRRFARGEYLGLHLTIGLLLSLVTLGIFIATARNIRKEHGRLEKFDVAVAQQMDEHAQHHPILLQVLRVVTRTGGVLALMALTLCGSLLLLARGRRLEGTVWLVAAIVGGLIDLVLKVAIARHRPFNPDPSITEANASFPSGHAMGSLVGYGMLAYVLVVRLRGGWARLGVVAGLGLYVLAIGFSRIYLRAHYFSDVVGGFSVGAVWLAVCVSGLESVRLRRGALPQQGDPGLAGRPHLALKPHSERQVDGGPSDPGEPSGRQQAS